MANVDALIEQLSSKDYYERSTAARALGDVRDPRASAALIGALQDPDEWVLEYAAEALGRLGDARATPALVPLLDHRHYKVRTAAASALGTLGDPEALPGLQAHAADADSWVRDAVQKAIRRIESGAGDTPPASGGPAPVGEAAARADLGPGEANPDDAVSAAAARVGAQTKRLSDGSHLLRVTLANGRHQKVRVITDEQTSTGAGRVRLVTILGPATPKAATWSMRQNLRITRGAIGLIRLRGRDLLALTETVLAAEATVDHVTGAVLRLANRGDRLEAMLTDTDAW